MRTRETYQLVNQVERNSHLSEDAFSVLFT